MAPKGKRKPRKATKEGLRQAALSHLARFASSSGNLRQVLLRRVQRSHRAHGTDLEKGARTVDELIARFQEVGLLDDRQYAAQKAESLHRRGASLRKITAELGRRKIDPTIIEDATRKLSEEVASVDLVAAIAYARRRRLGPWSKDREGLVKEGSRDRALRSLGRQGFSYEVATKVVDAESSEILEQIEKEARA